MRRPRRPCGSWAAHYCRSWTAWTIAHRRPPGHDSPVSLPARALVSSVVFVLLAAIPASAAALPHGRDRKRAAEKAHYTAVPAPSILSGFVFGGIPGSNGESGIGGYHRRMPHSGSCPSFTYQSVYGFFWRPGDAASLSTSYSRETPACSRGADTRKYVRIGSVRALGTRIALYRLPEFAPAQTSYAVRGMVRGQRFHFELTYQTGGVPRGGIVRLAESLRWVRGPAPCAPVIASKHRLVRAREVDESGTLWDLLVPGVAGPRRLRPRGVHRRPAVQARRQRRRRRDRCCRQRDRPRARHQAGGARQGRRAQACAELRSGARARLRRAGLRARLGVPDRQLLDRPHTGEVQARCSRADADQDALQPLVQRTRRHGCLGGRQQLGRRRVGDPGHVPAPLRAARERPRAGR